MANNLVMNSLNLGIAPKNGNSEYISVSQKALTETLNNEISAKFPSLPDTSDADRDKTYSLKWNNTDKKFEWVEG